MTDPETPNQNNDAEATRIIPAASPAASHPRTPPADEQTEIDEQTVVTVRTSPETASTYLREGDVIKGRFVLESCIGRGGMGTVYKALDVRKQEMQDQAPFVAIKFLNEELQDREDALIALQREAKKSQALAHPNIITVYDFDREGDRVFLSMEFLEGKTLKQMIQDGFYNKKAIDKLLVIIDRIARGLAYAHQQGFVHSDLKPSNVFLTDEGTVKLLDFGIAQAVRFPHKSLHTDHTHFDPHSLGAITPRYASPEMLADQVPVPADDMYALGCIAYALFSGHHPFRDTQGRPLTATDAKAQGLSVAPIDFLPKSLMQSIQKCLQFERENRFHNAGEFLDAVKPRSKQHKRATLFIGALALVAALSWWVTLEQSAVTVSLQDLPTTMSNIKQALQSGDERLAKADVDQAYKLYAQAWEDAAELAAISQRDRLNLKVLVDRRVDKIATTLIEKATSADAGPYQLMQIRLSLEFLEKAPIGTRQAQIRETLARLPTTIPLSDTPAQALPE